MASEITGKQAIQQSENISLGSLLGYFTVVFFLVGIGFASLFAVLDVFLGTDSGFSTTIATMILSGSLLARRVRLKEGAYADKSMIRYLSRMTFLVPLGLGCLVLLIALAALPEALAPFREMGSTALALVVGFAILISFLLHFLFIMLGMSGYNKWHKKRMEKLAGH